MKKLILNAPFNNLSFGNVSVNFARELYRKGVDCCIFPIGDQVDLATFDKLDKGFIDWLNSAINNRHQGISPDTPTLQMWHINGSETRFSRKKILYTFYELDQPTSSEINLVNHQDLCIFSSQHAARSFEDAGCRNTTHCPIGFDPDLSLTHKTYLPNKVHFGLMGKFEKRKRTEQILKNWAQKYGNNYKYQLSCVISNPFFQAGQLDALITRALDGRKYGNINFLPHLQTNSDVNDYINAIDIELSGLSGAEGWNLPAFNASALGKWSVVLNATSHKDWATPTNSILIEPSFKETAVDAFFFHPNAPFNQGFISGISDEEMIAAFERAEGIHKQENSEGLQLQKDFAYSKTIDTILSHTHGQVGQAVPLTS